MFFTFLKLRIYSKSRNTISHVYNFSWTHVFSSPCFTRSGLSSIRSFFSTNFLFCFVFSFLKIFFSPLRVILNLGWVSTLFKCRYIQLNTLYIFSDRRWLIFVGPPAAAGSVLLHRVYPSFRLSVSFLRISSLVFF